MQEKVNLITKLENGKLKINLEILDENLIGKEVTLLIVDNINNSELYKENLIISINNEFIIEVGNDFFHFRGNITLSYNLTIFDNFRNKPLKRYNIWTNIEESKFNGVDSENFNVCELIVNYKNYIIYTILVGGAICFVGGILIFLLTNFNMEEVIFFVPAILFLFLFPFVYIYKK